MLQPSLATRPASAAGAGAGRRAQRRLQLRPYQQECLDAIVAAYTAGCRRQLVELPTGTGKTVLFATVLARRLPKRGIILVHTDELVTQAVAKVRMVAPDVEVGVVKGARDEHTAPIVVASVQTLARPNRLERLTPDFATGVIDEAHHAVAPSYRRVLTGLRLIDGEPGNRLLLGVTATPDRADGIGLICAFERTVYRKTLPEMISDGYLTDLRGIRVTLEADLDSVHTRGGDLADGELGAALEAANAPEHIAAAYAEHTPDRKAIAFVPTVALAHATARACNAAGINAEAIDGNMPLDDRRAVIARFRDGETKVIVNCAILTEGFDEPAVDCVIVARPTKSRALFAQMVGRGTRPYPGKSDCVVLDMVGNTLRHRLIGLGDLVGLPVDALARGGGVRQLLARQQEMDVAETARRQLVAETVDLFRQHHLHWITTRGGGFLLPLGNGALHLVSDADGLFSVELRPMLGTREIVASGLDLGYAQGMAEDIVRERGAGGLTNPRAAWRREPATLAQAKLLRRWGLWRPDMTKGEAADAITLRKAAS